MVFARLEPFGSDAFYLASAIVATVTANVHRGKNQEAYKIVDFMPDFGRPKEEEQSNAAALQFVEVLTAALGGKDLRPKDD